MRSDDWLRFTSDPWPLPRYPVHPAATGPDAVVPGDGRSWAEKNDREVPAVLPHGWPHVDLMTVGACRCETGARCALPDPEQEEQR